MLDGVREEGLVLGGDILVASWVREDGSIRISGLVLIGMIMTYGVELPDKVSFEDMLDE